MGCEVLNLWTFSKHYKEQFWGKLHGNGNHLIPRKGHVTSSKENASTNAAQEPTAGPYKNVWGQERVVIPNP